MTTSTATDKQISYAMSLLAKAGYGTQWMDSSYKRWATMSERSGSVRDWLASMTRARISGLIDDLK